MQNRAAMVFDDEEAREQLEGQRGDGEEIAGDDRLAVVGEEGRPAAGGITAAWHAAQIAGDAAFGDVEAELQEFPVDPGCPPVRILRRQATDEGPNLLADPRPAPALSGSPAPVEAKAGSMPPDDGFRFHDEQHVRPSGPQMPEGGPEEAVEASAAAAGASVRRLAVGARRAPGRYRCDCGRTRGRLPGLAGNRACLNLGY